MNVHKALLPMLHKGDFKNRLCGPTEFVQDIQSTLIGCEILVV